MLIDQLTSMATKSKTSANLIRALYNLGREHDSLKRKSLLNAGLIEMIKWFSLAARKIMEQKMLLPKQTQKFMEKHRDDVRKLASPLVDPESKRNIILKRGGGGFFGGVIIRSLIRWDGNKLLRKFPQNKVKVSKKKPKKKSKKTPKKKVSKKARKVKINDRYVTVRIKKPVKPRTPRNSSPIAGPSWQKTPSPITSVHLSTPSSSLRKIGETLTPRKTPTISPARFSPLTSRSPTPIHEKLLSLEPSYLRTARQFGFEAAMKQLGYNQPFRVNNRGPNLKLTKRKLHL